MSLKDAAQETLAILEAGAYQAPSGRQVEIGAWQQEAVQETRLYTPSMLDALRSEASEGEAPRVEVIDATTQIAAQRLAADGDVALLNFASARSVGGGFLAGARAQEEDLCRCSGLYPCLEMQPTYYDVNRRQSSLHYTDHAIYSSGVPFFRVAGREALLEEPFRASVITAPAPNTGPILKREPDAGPAIEATFRRRWGNVYAIARHNGHRVLVLGAWGCGAFQGDPEVAAETARSWIDAAHFGGSFERIVFAIPDTGRQSARNFATFERVLAGAGRKP